MTAFYDLPFFPRSMFGLWAFLLCCAGIVGIILSFVFGRYRYALLSVVSLAPAYFLWQVIFNIYRVIKNNPVVALDPSARWLGKLPWLIWVLAFIPLTLAALWAMHLNVRYSRAFITPLAIKQCGDKMPCGICYWLDNGRVIFSNICMNGLCLALTGEPLLNGNSFRNALTEGTQRVRDEVWRFTFRDLTFNGRLLHEMVAWDVTEIMRKQKRSDGITKSCPA